MTNPMIRIHNTETDEIIDREMTSEEFKQYNKDLADLAAVENKVKQESSSKSALLAKLGLTAEEAALLLG